MSLTRDGRAGPASSFRRERPRGLLGALLCACLAAAGCGGEERRAPGAEAHAGGEQSIDQAAREIEDEAKQTDAGFRGSPTGSAVRRLPIGEPPLRVRQYIVGGGGELVARVRARDFFCDGNLAARRAAVASFYRSASRTFRRAGAEDLDLTVAVLTADLDDIRPLAHGRSGGTFLTPRGMKRGDC